MRVEKYTSSYGLEARLYKLPHRPGFILCRDLARFYQIGQKQIYHAVRKNASRFPQDHAFQLKKAEWETVCKYGRIPKPMQTEVPPLVFTTRGAAAVASVINTPVAAQASVDIIRAVVLGTEQSGHFYGGATHG